MYNESDITWSSIEKFYSYKNAVWVAQKNGIPIYALYDENGDKITINIDDCFK